MDMKKNMNSHTRTKVVREKELTGSRTPKVIFTSFHLLSLLVKAEKIVVLVYSPSKS